MSKILVINNSGNVGKSFISREMIYPNMSDCKIVEVESNNSSSSEFNVQTEKISGNNFEKLNRLFMRNDNLVIDLGASQIEKFFEELEQNDKEILEEIDLIIVPVIPNIKEIEDTLTLLEELKKVDLGIKIEVILNRCRDIKKFDFFIQEAKNIGFKVDTNLSLQEYKAISSLEEEKILTTEIIANDKDYKKLAKEAYRNNDEELGDKYSDMYLLKSGSKAIREDLNKIYTSLMSKI